MPQAVCWVTLLRSALQGAPYPLQLCWDRQLLQYPVLPSGKSQDKLSWQHYGKT